MKKEFNKKFKDDTEYLNFLPFINGTLYELNAKEFVNKVKNQKRSLHTNRINLKTENEYIVYHIVLDIINDFLYVDIIEDSFERNKGIDNDDFKSYTFDEHQKKVLSINCGNKENKWNKAVDIIEQFKKENANEMIEESTNNMKKYVDDNDYGD